MSLAGVRRIKLADAIGTALPEAPWIADIRTYDVPPTIAACIRGLATGCVAVTLSMMGGAHMIDAAERAAAERGVRVLWWFGPSHHELSAAGKWRMIAAANSARERYAGLRQPSK